MTQFLTIFFLSALKDNLFSEHLSSFNLTNVHFQLLEILQVVCVVERTTQIDRMIDMCDKRKDGGKKGNPLYTHIHV